MTQESTKTWFGHPAGLSTLFFTELWERFSYYGMRGLLVLFMMDQVDKGGFAMDQTTATSIYGLYTASVYLLCLPGGWIADRLLGAQKAIWIGGLIIAAGHFTLAIPTRSTFFLGLVLVAIGTGFLKPNISAVVGQLYPEGGARRDAGFTIFYMGINAGAFIGPLVCSYLGEKINWHLGFGAAGVGMILGVIQYRFSVPLLGDAGREPGGEKKPFDRNLMLAGFGIIAVVVVLALAGVLKINPVLLADHARNAIVGLAVAFFVYVFAFGGLNATERKQTGVIVVLFVGAAMFWSGFEQAGSSLNIFAKEYTDRMVFGFEVPAGWFQSLNPLYIILLAPVFASLWVALAKRMLDPSVPAKFALGLVLLGVGFLAMVGAAKLVTDGGKAGPYWLILTYLLHTMGELCLSPVGLSSVTKLAPKRFVGQMMGIWFVAAALGNLIAGQLAGRFDSKSLQDMPALFTQIVLTTVGTGLVLLVFTKPIKKLMGNIK